MRFGRARPWLAAFAFPELRSVGRLDSSNDEESRVIDRASGTRTRMKVGALAVAALGLVLSILAVTGLEGGDRPPKAAAASTPDTAFLPVLSYDGTAEPPTPTLTAVPTPTPTAAPPRPSSAEGLRIWSDGDSTSYFMTLAFFDLMARSGAVPVRAADYKISSGLANRGSSAVLFDHYTDWPTYMAQEMATYEPTVVVFMIGANDAGYAAGNPEEYQARVAAFMDQLQAPGRFVFWVGEPTLTRPDLARNIPVVNAIYAEEAAMRPWVTFVDTTVVVADAGDGVHFSRGAGYVLAELVIAAIFPPRPVCVEALEAGPLLPVCP
jgi:uncharacterized protein